MDKGIRLRLATRIHFALLRQYDENVDVATLLQGGLAAQEALWVCEASGDTELRNFGLQFAAATAAAEAQAQAGHAPQETPWAHNTSGFGVSRPVVLSAAPPPPMAQAGWRNPLRWLRSERKG